MLTLHMTKKKTIHKTIKIEGLVTRAIKFEGYFVSGALRSSGLGVTNPKLITRVTKTENLI